MTNQDPGTSRRPDDQNPWALNLVVRLEKDVVVYEQDLLVAAAQATLALLYDDRATTSWQPAIDRWRDGRIRKLCRRARGAKWHATDELDHVEVTVATATVRAFVPTAVASQPPALAKLQMAGTDLPARETTYVVPTPNALEILIAPDLTMSSAKAAVQVAHAAQLATARLDPAVREQWFNATRPVFVRPATDLEWRTLQGPDVVVVHDAGFTEVLPGSRTCAARFRSP